MERDRLLVALLTAPPAQLPVFVHNGASEGEGVTGTRMFAALEYHGKTVTLLHGSNTRDECRQIATKLPNRCVVVTSTWHVLRAFLTMLRVLQESGQDRRIRLWMMGAADDQRTWEQELAKIAEYHTLGHVASFRDGLAYCAWRNADAP